MLAWLNNNKTISIEMDSLLCYFQFFLHGSYRKKNLKNTFMLGWRSGVWREAVILQYTYIISV